MSGSLNHATMAEKVTQFNGKSITTSGQTVVAICGGAAALTAAGIGNIVGWRIGAKDSQATPANRLEIHWGDATAQEEVVAAGEALDWTTCPVRDPADVYVKAPVQADNCVISIFHRIDGN